MLKYLCSFFYIDYTLGVIPAPVYTRVNSGGNPGYYHVVWIPAFAGEKRSFARP